MISIQNKFIFLHIPKTGGNSLQEAFLPFSDDKKILGEHRDGVDRYELKGPITPFKHAKLSDYKRLMGDTSGLSIIVSVRHPVARAVSFYFSPHRWMRQQPDGSWLLTEATWDREEFLALLPRIDSMASFLMEDGRFRKPDHMIRFESLLSDYRKIIDNFNFPAPVDLHVRNQSLRDGDAKRSAVADPVVAEAVRRHHADDIKFFGY